jgi:hypothetical protein
MSKLTDKLREKGVFNPHNFYGAHPYIVYRASYSRSCIPSCWGVVVRGQNLGEAWYDHGARTFTGFGADGEGTSRTKGLLQAQKWASEKFGITTWKRDPFGSYGEIEFVKQHIKDLS